MSTATRTSAGQANGRTSALNGGTATKTPDPRLTQAVASRKEKRAPQPQIKHASAVHTTNRASLFSQDAETSPSTLGFRNLMGLVIIISNVRLMMENFQKYGLLVTLSGGGYRQQDLRWFWILYLMTPGHLFLAYLIELMAAKYATTAMGRAKKSSENGDAIKRQAAKNSFFSTWTVIALAHTINATFMVAFATYVVYAWIFNPGLGSVTEMHAVIVWLKVCSYALTNRDLRQAYLSPDPSMQAAVSPFFKSCPYPQNISFGNLCYFWWAPTLVYQPVYPRSDKIRWGFVVRRMCECVILVVLIYVTIVQYGHPTMKNSIEDISNLRGIHILERVMKLSTISVVCWLAGFFAIFHSFLNAAAEVMRFGDREFYSDWWNSSDVRSYWSSWNKPVTHFMKRHIYGTVRTRGFPAPVAQFATFLFSGILHELLIGVPTHNVLGVAFFGMIGQIPLIYMTDALKKYGGNGHTVRLAGNLTFWLSFCIFGQPLAAILYFFAWVAKYGNGTGSRPVWPELKFA